MEKGTLVMNPIQRLGGCMTDFKEFCTRNVLTFLPVNHPFFFLLQFTSLVVLFYFLGRGIQ